MKQIIHHISFKGKGIVLITINGSRHGIFMTMICASLCLPLMIRTCLADKPNEIRDQQPQHIFNNQAVGSNHEELAHISGLELVTRDNETQFILNIDKPVEYNIFVLAEPNRIVIDLENTIGPGPFDVRDLKNDLIHLVRRGTHEGNRLRFVLDLSFPGYAKSSMQRSDKNGQYRLTIAVHRILSVDNTRKIIEPLSEMALAAAKKPPPDGDMVRLGLKYQDAPLGTIEAIEYSGGYLLSMSQLTQVLGYSLNVDPDNQLVEGWFIQPNKIFVMDIS